MLIYTKHDPRFYDRRLYKGGGGGSTSNQSNPTTTNTDKRIAVQDGIGVSGDGSSVSIVDNSNSSDAIKFMTQAGADIIKNSGAAVVDLSRFQGTQNLEAFDKLVTAGGSLVDKLIDQSSQGFALSGKVIESFKPTEKDEQKTMQYGLIAAAALVGVVLFKGK